MFWCDKLVEPLNGPQTINDSKTPSGRAHIGALRGPLIHDAIFRTLQSKGVPVRYLFGVDDYDPVDEIPYGQVEHFEKYLGAPLCNTPPPPGSQATDMAEHFISEFFSVFADLGIRPEFYRMRDIYRSGKFNEAIDAILRKADVVRRIYKEVSGSDRSETWHPFQVICENCGRIGTTEVTAYDGREVTYACRPHLVKWAQGCGHEGKMAPFDGKGKLPWKLEWCAKWRTFPVTIEGAGRDHSTKGGSRDVAAACLREIFGQEPPLNCPYDFFLVGGAKMSSSKGIGVTSRDMADFLPPEVLRFLMVRTPPRQHVNFEASEVHILKAFNEFDRAKHRYFHDAAIKPDDKRVYELAQVVPEPDYWTADFQLVAALVQMPHLDAVKELEKRKSSPFTELERKHLDLRIRAAKYWLEHYATEEEKTRLQETLPARAAELSAAQRGFLHILAEQLRDATWQDEALQIAVFNAARLTPIDQPAAFKAVYRVLLDRESGPKAGNLLSFLDREFVIRRFNEAPWNEREFLEATGLTAGAFERWLMSEKAKIVSISARYKSIDNEVGTSYVEFLMVMTDGKNHCRRVLLGEGKVEEAVRMWIGELESRTGFAIAYPRHNG
ncbi:MAG: lysine--tRNA ligase [Methylacidiphilales bacterium]|nr:lysine--tRNA ligase [Candidatus Methylacidiphilales bacterium]